MLEHRNFVKKLVFAVETLPVNLVVSGLVSELFAVALYCVFLVIIRHGLPHRHCLAARADYSAGSVYGRDLLVSGGTRSVCTRPRPDHGLHHYDLVLHHSYLLLRGPIAGARAATRQESDHCPGPRLPRRIS